MLTRIAAFSLCMTTAACSLTSEARKPDSVATVDGGAGKVPSVSAQQGGDDEWQAAEAIAVREGTHLLMKPRHVERMSPGVRYGFVVDPSVGKRKYVLVRGATVFGGQGPSALAAFARAVDLTRSHEWDAADALAVVVAYSAWPPDEAANPEAYHRHPAGDRLADLNPKMEYDAAEARFVLYYDVAGGPSVGRGSAVGPKILYLNKYTLHIGADYSASWSVERATKEVPRF